MSAKQQSDAKDSTITELVKQKAQLEQDLAQATREATKLKENFEAQTQHNQVIQTARYEVS